MQVLSFAVVMKQWRMMILMFLLGGCDSLTIISFMQTFAFRKAIMSAALLRLERELQLSSSVVNLVRQQLVESTSYEA